MTRSITRIAGAILVLAMAMPVAWGKAEPVEIQGISVDRFPKISISFSVSGLAPGETPEVEIVENGESFVPSSVRALHAERGVDVVLAIDVSGSMAGEGIVAAKSAARRFLSTLPDEIPVGIAAFAEDATILEPITSDRDLLLNEISSLTPSGETSLYDGVKVASTMFSGTAQHNIVLLSDGGDTASTATLREAVKAARGSKAAVYSLGLVTPDADVAALKRISNGTKGTYSPAAAADLTGLFTGLATSIGNQFRVRYESGATAGTQLTLSLETPQGSDRAVVLAPALEKEPASPSAGVGRAPVAEPPPMAVVIGLFFLASFFIALLLLRSSAGARRRAELTRRISMSTGDRSSEIDDTDSDKHFASWVPDSFTTMGERLANVTGLGAALELKLERASAPIKSGEFVALSIGSGVLGAFVLGLVLQGVVFAAVGLVIGFFVPRLLLGRAIRRRFERLHEQLADILMILASSLRSGHSFLQALDLVAKQVEAPGSEEFGRVVAEVQLGRPVNEALLAMADRGASEDLRWAVLAMNVQREVGGNLAEVLDTIAETLREREVVRRQVGVLSAEGRLSAAIMLALPFIFALYMAKVSPQNFKLLYSTGLGLSMVGGASLLLLAGFFWLRKVVKIDV